MTLGAGWPRDLSLSSAFSANDSQYAARHLVEFPRTRAQVVHKFSLRAWHEPQPPLLGRRLPRYTPRPTQLRQAWVRDLRRRLRFQGKDSRTCRSAGLRPDRLCEGCGRPAVVTRDRRDATWRLPAVAPRAA